MLEEIFIASRTFNVQRCASLYCSRIRLSAGASHQMGPRTGRAGRRPRTFPLVAIASCGFIQAAETVLKGEPGATARVIEGVITGVGFIDGGAMTFITLKALTPLERDSRDQNRIGNDPTK